MAPRKRTCVLNKFEKKERKKITRYSVFLNIIQLQMPHENEPEFVARARYAIFLEDRQYGRLNDEQAARILEDIKQNLPQEEKVTKFGQ